VTAAAVPVGASPPWPHSAVRPVVSVHHPLDVAFDACVTAADALPQWLATEGGYAGAGVTFTVFARALASQFFSIGARVPEVFDPAPFAGVITPNTVHSVLSLVRENGLG